MSRKGTRPRAARSGTSSCHCAGAHVAAGRVVAAGVQDDDRPGRGRLQRGAHRREVDVLLDRVVVGVGADLEAGALEQGAVVLPARLADQHLGVGAHALEQIGADLEAAGAADRLDGGDPAGLARRVLGAEHQRLGRGVVGGDAVDRQVAARLGGLDQHLLGGADAAQDRQLAVLVVVDADAEIDLGGVGIGGELLVETQDRVAGRHLDGVEERRHRKSVLVERVERGAWNRRRRRHLHTGPPASRLCPGGLFALPCPVPLRTAKPDSFYLSCPISPTSIPPPRPLPSAKANSSRFPARRSSCSSPTSRRATSRWRSRGWSRASATA